LAQEIPPRTDKAPGRRRLGRCQGDVYGGCGSRAGVQMLGKKDMGTTVFPPMETALIDGDVAFREHSGGHTPGPNWPTFLTFASRICTRRGRRQRGSREVDRGRLFPRF